MVKVGFSLSTNELEWLTKMAKRQGCTMGDIIRQSISDYVFLRRLQLSGNKILVKLPYLKEVVLQ